MAVVRLSERHHRQRLPKAVVMFKKGVSALLERTRAICHRSMLLSRPRR